MGIFSGKSKKGLDGFVDCLRTCLHKTGVRICGKILSMARQKSAGILAYFKDF